MNTEKRKAERRKVTYYIPVTEFKTRRMVGVLMDISSKGIRLDSSDKVAIGQVRQFYIDLLEDIASESARIFTGSCRWCESDDIDPTSCVAGYEFVNPTKENAAFFQRVFDTYSVKSNRNQFDNSDYMWK